MKKKIFVLLLSIITFFIDFDDINATITGTCTCYNPYNFDIMPDISCNTWQDENNFNDDDVLRYNDSKTGENACDRICESKGGNYHWAASTGLYGVKGEYIYKDVIGDDWKDEWTKGCYKTSDNPNATTNKCETKYTEADCKKQLNTVWDSDKKCCNLKEVCWYYGYSSLVSEGGTVVWSKKSPCTDENKKKHPDQNCHIIKEFDMEICKSKEGKNLYLDEIERDIEIINNFKIPEPNITIKENTLNCKELIGENLTKILKFAIEVLSIAGAIIAIVNAMISLIPALIAKDADALKKAQKKCINMAIVLVLILLLPTLIIFIGRLFGYDLSCIV